MPACAKSDGVAAMQAVGLTLRTIVVGALIFVATPTLGAGFAVGSIQARAVDKTLHVTGNLDLSLTSKVEEAISKGIPIQPVIDLRLYRHRALLWDARVKTWSMRRELSYHALSGQYLIGGTSTDAIDRESFVSLNEALTELGTLDDVTLPLDAALAADATYRLDVRVGLDIEALPSLLRPVAYTSSDWNLNSGWTSWKVQH